jgi:hypothetical protein
MGFLIRRELLKKLSNILAVVRHSRDGLGRGWLLLMACPLHRVSVLAYRGRKRTLRLFFAKTPEG